jgi:hypothetical protein
MTATPHIIPELFKYDGSYICLQTRDWDDPIIAVVAVGSIHVTTHPDNGIFLSV